MAPASELRGGAKGTVDILREQESEKYVQIFAIFYHFYTASIKFGLI